MRNRIQGKCVALLCCLTAGLIGQTVFGQAPALTEQQKSVVLFDIRANRLMESMSELGVKSEELESLPIDGPMDGIKVTQIKRIFGSMSLPPSVDAFMGMEQARELPMELFIQFEFNDNEAADRMLENFSERANEIEVNGETYYNPEPSGVSNFFGHKVNATTFEMGTKNYLLQSGRRFSTKRLQSAFAQAPNEAIRVVIDLETPSELIADGVQMGKDMLPGMAAAYLGLIEKSNSIILTADMSGDNLLTLMVNGNNEEDAETVRSGLDALLGLGKMAMNAQMAEATKGSPEAAQFAKTLSDSMVATRNGTEVKIAIAKPEGFVEVMQQMQKQARGAAMAASKMNDFRMVALSMHNYFDVHKSFPFEVKGELSQDLSWRARVLPYLELMQIYDQMDMRKGASEEPNSTFADQMPAIFGADGKNSTITTIKYDRPVKSFADVIDGTSNTIVMIEYPAGKPWLENNAITIDEAVNLVAGLADGEELIVCFYDGFVRKISNQVDRETLRNLFDPRDGKIVNDF